MKKLSFQEIILKLLNFWSKQGCTILQSYDMEVGAGTFHPATALNVLGPNPLWKVAYVQPCSVHQMDDMEKIQIGFSIITNFKLLFSHLQIIYKICILKA